MRKVARDQMSELKNQKPVSRSQRPGGRRGASAAGITLMELLVAMALIAILSALVYPSFGNALADLRLNGAGRQVVSACRLAKSEAVARRESFRLIVNIEKNQVALADASLRTLKELEFPAGIRIIQVQKFSETGAHDVSDFYFFPNGTAESGSLTFRDERGKVLKVVIDFLTGDAKVAS